ncbi:hypothetical protein ACCO45_000577 [Purpureocillium lilacinum]|uniref:Uncharacterized protein n=1 Tax=Purpureocillium lilacinum TaxID=33203 RepID=A0ACC4E5T5_PURLI
MAASTTTEEQSPRSREKAPVLEPPLIHIDPRQSQMTSQTMTAHGPYPVGYWHRDDQLDFERPPRDQLAIETPSYKASNPTMGYMPMYLSSTSMWVGSQGGHQTQSSLPPYNLSQYNCGSVFESGFPQHNLNRTSGQNEITQVADPGSSDPRMIPRTTPPILVYPHSMADITAACHNRFREVVSMFRENTEKHHELAPFVQHIDYTLRISFDDAII